MSIDVMRLGYDFTSLYLCKIKEYTFTNAHLIICKYWLQFIKKYCCKGI